MMINFCFFIGRHLRRRLAKVAMSSKPPGEAPTRQDVAWFQGFQASLLPSTARLVVLEPFSSEITFSGVRLKSTASRLTHSEWKSHRDLTDVGQHTEPRFGSSLVPQAKSRCQLGSCGSRRGQKGSQNLRLG